MNNFLFISLLLSGLFYCTGVTAQDSLQYDLDEIVVSDTDLSDYSFGYYTTKLTDSVIQKNSSSFSDLLRFHSHIYLKENGYGMVSSPSFRGTNASHTAVVWNGLNIQSQLNGQGDFNTILPDQYDDIQIRRGGGSVEYGSGAIGGSVHLNQNLPFTDQAATSLSAGYGSFDTRQLHLAHQQARNKWSYSVNFTHQSSDNDYKYPGTDQQNENGAFKRTGVNAAAGFLINTKQSVKLYHRSFTGDRNLSGTIASPSRSKYDDDQHNSQIVYRIDHNRMVSKFRFAHLYERFRYYENKESDRFTYGNVRTLLARYENNADFNKKAGVRSFLQYRRLRGLGTSFGTPTRNEVAVTSKFHHQPMEQLHYLVSVRKDFISEFESPVVFSFSGNYLLTNEVSLKLNGSRNFKQPTFNDLYWQPGGNTDLEAETSYQIDMGAEWQSRETSAELHGFYIHTKNMIRWLPGDNQVWEPMNEDSVTGSGLELNLHSERPITLNERLTADVQYAFTQSVNDKTKKQLMYVPEHKLNGNLSYQNRNWNLFYQQLYNSKVTFTGGQLSDYTVANAGIAYELKNKKAVTIGLQVRINNLYNTYYENVAYRPMPNRNIQSKLTLQF